MTCIPTVVTAEAITNVVLTQDAATTPVVVGNNFAASIGGAAGTCCAETSLTSGVKYDGEWAHSNQVNFNATIG